MRVYRQAMTSSQADKREKTNELAGGGFPREKRHRGQVAYRIQRPPFLVSYSYLCFAGAKSLYEKSPKRKKRKRENKTTKRRSCFNHAFDEQYAHFAFFVIQRKKKWNAALKNTLLCLYKKLKCKQIFRTKQWQNYRAIHNFVYLFVFLAFCFMTM